MAKQKYYVVWNGYQPGVYDNWADAEEQIKGFSNASFRSFSYKEDAIKAFREGFDKQGLLKEINNEMSRLEKEGTVISFDSQSDDSQDEPEMLTFSPVKEEVTATPQTPCNHTSDPTYPTGEALIVDAACSGNPGPMEYRGLKWPSGEELFHYAHPKGTNNIGEFLAIVHALAYMEQKELRWPVYSDSRNAMLWINLKKCKTTLKPTSLNADLFDVIARAERWLSNHAQHNTVLKWNTSKWGEIPADFGRK